MRPILQTNKTGFGDNCSGINDTPPAFLHFKLLTMTPKFTRLEIALFFAIVILICSCEPGKWVAGNTMKGHYFSKQQVALRAYNDSLKTIKP